MIGDEWDNKDDKFRFYITIRRLIEFSSNFKLVLQTDGTYKLTWVKNPILIVGSSDFNRVFHTIGQACFSREYTDIQSYSSNIQFPEYTSSSPPVYALLESASNSSYASSYLMIIHLFHIYRD